MTTINGRTVGAGLHLSCDVVVVGSGPAGATVAADLASTGASVIVVEVGRWWEPSEFRASTFGAMASGFRAMGSSMVVGPAPIPYVQGRMVGGSSPVNGAICWRLTPDVHRSWTAGDPALEEGIPWDAIEAATDRIETRLGVAPTDPAVAGPKNELMAIGADALGLEHRPIRRNVGACRGLGRCLQGCPEGRKHSVDRTLLADALGLGATVLSSVEVTSVLTSRGRAIGVVGRAEGGGAVRIDAERAVVLAASAVQTPALLLASGIHQGPVGRHFSAHPGVSLAGRFPEPVRNWEGASQGHEVTGLRHEGLKFETMGLGVDLLAARLHGVGAQLAQRIEELDRYADWGAAVRAGAQGRVRLVRGRAVVTYRLTAHDIARFRRGLRIMGEMMFAAGATSVEPGVRAYRPVIDHPSQLRHLEQHGPRHAAAYTAAITHMFGTARMGSDPADSVVRPDFRHHQVDRLYVADSSVFPSNTGVNPQVPIMALAALCARHVTGTDLDAPLGPPPHSPRNHP